MVKEERSPYLHFTFALVMATLPIATAADTAPSNTSQSCADKQAETGELFTCVRYHKPYRATSLSGEAISPQAARISDVVSSSKETVPLPLEVVVPKDHLPDILEVYDTSTFRSATSYNVPSSTKLMSDAVWNSWEKFLARCPIKFVRVHPRVRIYSMLLKINVY